jgi:hypothetical protein
MRSCPGAVPPHHVSHCKVDEGCGFHDERCRLFFSFCASVRCMSVLVNRSGLLFTLVLFDCTRHEGISSRSSCRADTVRSRLRYINGHCFFSTVQASFCQADIAQWFIRPLKRCERADLCRRALAYGVYAERRRSLRRAPVIFQQLAGSSVRKTAPTGSARHDPVSGADNFLCATSLFCAAETSCGHFSDFFVTSFFSDRGASQNRFE